MSPATSNDITEQHHHDDAVLLAAIAAGPTNVNVLYLLPRDTWATSDVTEAIHSVQLVEDGFGLLKLLGSEERVTAAVTRCLRSGHLYARCERDPDDLGFTYVVLVMRPRARA